MAILTMWLGCVSRWALASLACLPVGALIWYVGRIQADRMVAADQAWEMAFYLSPLVFRTVDALLILGSLLGLIGLGVGPGVRRRVQSAVAALLCVGMIAAVRWR